MQFDGRLDLFEFRLPLAFSRRCRRSVVVRVVFLRPFLTDLEIIYSSKFCEQILPDLVTLTFRRMKVHREPNFLAASSLEF